VNMLGIMIPYPTNEDIAAALYLAHEGETP